MRFGALIAFGDIQFSGVGAVSRAVSGWPLSFEAEYDTGLVSVGKPFMFDTQGVSAAPLKGPPTLTYEYILFAGYGTSDGVAFAQVEAQWRAIWVALQSTYSWASPLGTVTSTGQKGDLLIADADPSLSFTYKATARVLKPAPWKLVKGAPRHLVVEIPFAMLSDFTVI